MSAQEILMEVLNSLIPALAPVLAGYIIYVINRLLNIKLDASARDALDSAMQNGADWIIHEGRMPTALEVLDYVRRAAPEAAVELEINWAPVALT